MKLRSQVSPLIPLLIHTVKLTDLPTINQEVTFRVGLHSKLNMHCIRFIYINNTITGTLKMQHSTRMQYVNTVYCYTFRHV